MKIVLSGGGKIAGSVNDDDGAPIGNAEVEGSAEGAGQATRTRDDGTFLLEGVKPGAWHVVATRCKCERDNE